MMEDIITLHREKARHEIRSSQTPRSTLLLVFEIQSYAPILRTGNQRVFAPSGWILILCVIAYEEHDPTRSSVTETHG